MNSSLSVSLNTESLDVEINVLVEKFDQIDLCLPQCFRNPEQSLLYSNEIDLSADEIQREFKNYADSQTITAEDAARVEMLTRAQSDNKHWNHIRRGRITASHFGSICKRGYATPPDKLVSAILQYKPFHPTASMLFGLVNEERALGLYQTWFQQKYDRQLTIKRPGLFLCKDSGYGWLGASPDAIITCENEEEWLVEIKTIYPSEKNKNATTVRDLLNSKQKSSLCFEEDEVSGELDVKQSHKYYYQVMGQLGITGYKSCDLIVCFREDFEVFRIDFDPAKWADMLLKLRKFYVTGIVAELFSERVKNDKNLYEDWPF